MSQADSISGTWQPPLVLHSFARLGSAAAAESLALVLAAARVLLHGGARSLPSAGVLFALALAFAFVQPTAEMQLCRSSSAGRRTRSRLPATAAQHSARGNSAECRGRQFVEITPVDRPIPHTSFSLHGFVGLENAL